MRIILVPHGAPGNLQPFDTRNLSAIRPAARALGMSAALPFHMIRDWGTKPLPFTISTTDSVLLDLADGGGGVSSHFRLWQRLWLRGWALENEVFVNQALPNSTSAVFRGRVRKFDYTMLAATVGRTAVPRCTLPRAISGQP